MSRNPHRVYRIADILQEVLAKLIQQELKDPRIGMVTLTNVEVSRDLSHAKIYFSVYNEETYAQSTLLNLKKASRFLRSRVAKQVRLRVIPELHFYYDDTLIRARKIDNLLDQLL